MEEVGKFVRNMPVPRQGVAAHVDWDHYVRMARTQPGVPLLVAKNVRESLQKSLRQRNRYPWIDDTGRIRVMTRDGARDDAGVYWADVWFVWEPKEEDNN